MLNTTTPTVPTLSRPPLAPLNFADTYSLSSTNKIPFQTNTSLNTAANQYQMLYQPPTAPNMGPSETLLSSSSTLNLPLNKPFFCKHKKLCCTFVAMNKSVKTFDGLDRQNTPEVYLHQIDVYMILFFGRTTFRFYSL